VSFGHSKYLIICSQKCKLADGPQTPGIAFALGKPVEQLYGISIAGNPWVWRENLSSSPL